MWPAFAVRVREMKSLFVAASAAVPLSVQLVPPKVLAVVLSVSPLPSVNPPTVIFDAVLFAESGLFVLEFLSAMSQPAKVTWALMFVIPKIATAAIKKCSISYLEFFFCFRTRAVGRGVCVGVRETRGGSLPTERSRRRLELWCSPWGSSTRRERADVGDRRRGRRL